MTLHVFTDTSYNYNYKLDTMHMQSMCLGTMQVMQYTKQLTCDLRTSSNSPTNYDCASYSSLYKILWHLQFWYTNLQCHKIVIGSLSWESG